MTCSQVRESIDAYLDEELDPASRAQIDRHMETCHACASALQAAQMLETTIRNSSGLYAPAPEMLRREVATALRRTSLEPNRRARIGVPWYLFGLLTSAGLAALIVIALVPRFTGRANEDLLLRDVYAAHVRSLMPGHITDVASTDQHTVKPWFAGRIDYSPPVRDFAADGFPLIGGRLDYIGERPVAALVYQRHQHIINLFIWPPRTESDDQHSIEKQRNGYHLIRWQKGGMVFCLISDLNAAELNDLATMMQRDEGSSGLLPTTTTAPT